MWNARVQRKNYVHSQKKESEIFQLCISNAVTIINYSHVIHVHFALMEMLVYLVYPKSRASFDRLETFIIPCGFDVFFFGSNYCVLVFHVNVKIKCEKWILFASLAWMIRVRELACTSFATNVLHFGHFSLDVWIWSVKWPNKVAKRSTYCG